MRKALPLALACVTGAAASPIYQQATGITIQVCSPACVTVPGTITIQVTPGTTAPVAGTPAITVTTGSGTTTPPITVPPIVISPITGSPVLMSAMTLGTNQPWSGFLPGASTDVLRQDVSTAPTSPRDAAFKAAFGARKLDVDPTIPINVVNSKTQAVAWHSVNITAGYATPQVPLLGTEVIEPGSDHHLFLYDVGTGIWYEFYRWAVDGNDNISAESGYTFNANTALDTQNGIGLDSSNVAGTARPSMVRYDDAVAGTIKYATPLVLNTASRFFSADGRCFYGAVPPATHGDRSSGCTGGTSSLPALAYGDRFVLDPTLDLSGYSPEIRNLLKAWQTYGVYFDDLGGDGGTGYALLEADSRWNVDDLAQIKAHITMANFRQVQVNGASPVLPDSNDDDNGSDTVQYAWSYTVDSNGTYTPSRTLIPNTYNRPTLTAAVSASTVAIGNSVTLSASCVNGHDPYFDNAPPLSNGSITVTPGNTTTYTPYCRGPRGITIGAPLTVVVNGPQVATPAFSPAFGAYNAVQTVSITSSTPGSTINYTTDGTTATVNSPVYTAPITVSTVTPFSAIAHKASYINSPVVSGTYNVIVAGSAPQLAATAEHDSSGSATATPVTITNTQASNLDIVLVSMSGTATPPTSVTASNGSTGTLIGSVYNSASGIGTGDQVTLAAYQFPNMPSGAVSFTANFPTGYTAYAVTSVLSYIGAATANPVEGFVATSTAPGTCNLSLTTTGTNESVVEFVNFPYGSPSDPNASVLAGVKQGVNGSSGFALGRTVAAAGTTPIAITSSSGNYNECLAFAIKHP